ncbi:MAG: molybdopterin synthase catalytic subunit MoaE [Gammaproteobacteria bacterium]|nr:molybdopterin synthase catalytic subunit MoaE [Gammaproteobacteria bacterium]
MDIFINITTDDFDVGQEYQKLIDANHQDGAAVFFVGRVRADDSSKPVQKLELEHYPAMTKKALMQIAEKAGERWSVNQVRIWHRVGEIHLGEQIVFVGVSSRHRQSAFESAQFIMDYLKVEAPFWKKEYTADGEKWVEQADKDIKASQNWAVESPE